MSPPTSLPSATALAKMCAEKYTQITGSPLPDDVRTDLEPLADHFLGLNRLRELLHFVPWESFSRNPNGGHAAVADFLCCGALTLATTTNYDTHIEDAALQLGEGDFQSALDGVEAGELPDRHRPLVKLHGCHRRDRANTLWAHSQLDGNTAIRERLDRTRTWLTGQFAGRDLVIVGFWTDWDYLNDVLSDTLAGSEPRTVVVVNPDASQVLQRKAPALWTWAHHGEADFFHVREGAAEFLDDLRSSFSRGFVRRVLDGSGPSFANLFPGREIDDTNFIDPLSSDDLYLLRKDICGCSSKRSVGSKTPDGTMDLVGAFILAVVAAGATLDGACFCLQGRSIRILNCANRLLSHVKADFANDLGVAHDCNAVVCVGAVDDQVPSDLVRDSEPRTIVRQGWDGEWMTHESVREQLNL